MGVALWVMAYLAQIAFGMYVFVNYPKRANLPARVQTAHSYAAWAGFVPFVGLMLVVQLVAFAYYRSAVNRLGAQREQLKAQLPTSFGATPGTASVAAAPTAGPSPAARDNPFL